MKSMAEYLSMTGRLYLVRRSRFSERFVKNLDSLSAAISVEVRGRRGNRKSPGLDNDPDGQRRPPGTVGQPQLGLLPEGRLLDHGQELYNGSGQGLQPDHLAQDLLCHGAQRDNFDALETRLYADHLFPRALCHHEHPLLPQLHVHLHLRLYPPALSTPATQSRRRKSQWTVRALLK